MNRRGTPLDELYFSWLCKPLDKRWDVSFDAALLRVLFRTPFTYHVPSDKNRALDGVELRQKFLYRAPVRSSPWEIDGWMSLHCSMLEMLIGLAERGAYQTGDEMADWFYTFMVNLGLDQTLSSTKIHRTLQRVNERTYSSSGQGGLFPLMNPVEDQREVDLWYQMSAYIIENYDGRGASA